MRYTPLEPYLVFTSDLEFIHPNRKKHTLSPTATKKIDNGDGVKIKALALTL